MSRNRVLAVLGTRPEAVKLAPVLRELGAAVSLCASGQHRELLAGALAELGLKADFELAVMRPGQTPREVLVRVTRGLAPVLARLKPALVLVQGDTTTALAGALAAFHAGIPVAHVEAGLRTGDLSCPFPEESNRVLIGRLASLHFAPTAGARKNLLREGVPSRSIFITGNTAVDSVRWALARPGEAPAAGDYAVLTLHRRESFGAPLREILRGVERLVERQPELEVRFPVHPNPEVRRQARHVRHPRVRLLEPLGYVEFIRLMAGARLILTDSGGIVEEAPSLGKPVVILRKATERAELVTAGGAWLAGPDAESIAGRAAAVLADSRLAARLSRQANPFGDGKAAPRIARVLRAWLRRLA